MTPELRAKIEAEEKYPLYTREEIESVDISMVSMYLASNVEARSKRQVYIACATEYASKVEELTAKVSDLKEKQDEFICEFLEWMGTAYLLSPALTGFMRNAPKTLLTKYRAVLNSKEI